MRNRTTKDLLTPEVLHQQLFDIGYDVPMIVIKSWAVDDRRRIDTDLWVRKMRGERYKHRRPFPQFLAAFDMNLNRKRAMWRS